MSTEDRGRSASFSDRYVPPALVIGFHVERSRFGIDRCHWQPRPRGHQVREHAPRGTTAARNRCLSAGRIDHKSRCDLERAVDCLRAHDQLAFVAILDDVSDLAGYVLGAGLDRSGDEIRIELLPVDNEFWRWAMAVVGRDGTARCVKRIIEKGMELQTLEHRSGAGSENLARARLLWFANDQSVVAEASQNVAGNGAGNARAGNDDITPHHGGTPYGGEPAARLQASDRRSADRAPQDRARPPPAAPARTLGL